MTDLDHLKAMEQGVWKEFANFHPFIILQSGLIHAFTTSRPSTASRIG